MSVRATEGDRRTTSRYMMHRSGLTASSRARMPASLTSQRVAATSISATTKVLLAGKVAIAGDEQTIRPD